ncbi:MAG: hypothetical protein ACXACX_21765 [Candidatus Hodarchaeales archaeon]
MKLKAINAAAARTIILTFLCGLKTTLSLVIIIIAQLRFKSFSVHNKKHEFYR